MIEVTFSKGYIATHRETWTSFETVISIRYTLKGFDIWKLSILNEMI